MKRTGRWKDMLMGAALTALLLGMAVPALAASQARTVQQTLTYSGITLNINGQVVKPTDAQGNYVEPFTINGTTYLPVRAVANALDKDVQWDGATATVYITDKSGGGSSATPTPAPTNNNLVEVCPPYESSNAETYLNNKPSEKMTMAGTEYSNGIRLHGRSYQTGAYALFNLSGNYQTLEFDLGHIDGSKNYDRNIHIYLDGVLTQTIEAKAEALPEHYTIQLNGARQLKIELEKAKQGGYGNGEMYGLANCVLTPISK